MMFTRTLVVLSVALSALASPHMARGVKHHDIARRAAMPEAAPEPVLVAPPKVRKRASDRCKTRSSSSSAATTSSVSTSSSTPSTSSTHDSSSSSTHTSSSLVVPQNKATTKTSTSEAPATTSSTSSANDPLGILTGTHTGQATYYATGLGACGITNTDSDFIVAVSHELFDNYPGYAGGNPNNNPMCGKSINVNYNGHQITVKATDRCAGCAMFDLDFSPDAFSQLASQSLGRLSGMTWSGRKRTWAPVPWCTIPDAPRSPVFPSWVPIL
ncbi:RlpA-like double-psi beta-barrel-protein domain-containing protein-containing protein [Epithele typhae]|uniref:RlpA-like double-psi beta-barrel-protein domain-containing protein-containing protein n=1 Tax=Epithele typhae TaxID=378194 RepID=UPI002007EA97|nr:RlpA-like double-psi beta-barrel-protein domain-containing protein-containing protein [Epithele typhae]KAH9944071.1 RlpA-like double-psi beta-barrel-protein domain-containing protein-containing protein [Epithele typhae]